MRIGRLGSVFAYMWTHSPDKGVIVYPEGHRFKGEGTLQLKTGVMEVAYNLKLPCQIVLSNGKENIMDEISLKINRNVIVTICVSKVLDPTQFATKEEWFDYVKAEWEATYSKLHSSETDGRLFVGSLPGIAEKASELETAPPQRRKTAIAYTMAVISIVVALVALCWSGVCCKQTRFETDRGSIARVFAAPLPACVVGIW